jgi:endonuclease YncB( thermonuclease family)
MTRALAILLLCAAPATAQEVEAPKAPAPALILPAKVVEIVDGDTVELEISFRLRVRLAGIDAPELRGGTPESRYAAQLSRDHLRDHAKGEPCILQVPLTGAPTLGHLFSFERLVGRVWVWDECLSELQLANGMAEPK